jgi:uncharacterized protein
MTLLQKVQTEIVTAMKSRDEACLGTLRLIKAALDRCEKDQQKPLDEASEQKVLATMVKQRRDSIEMFTKGNRPELAEKEQAELVLIEGFMPKEATEAELDFAVQLTMETAGPGANMGSLMALAKAFLTGKRVDGRKLSEKIKAQLK